ncbi:hypothetical protein BS78_05G006700 [Paspalum vaginatum]|nr:hypothetical protein BS78_05G006700 [Paspalum vaginatum]
MLGAFNPFSGVAEQKVIYRGTYWIGCWSLLCKEEERQKLKIRCRHLEGVVLELVFSHGWRR